MFGSWGRMIQFAKYHASGRMGVERGEPRERAVYQEATAASQEARAHEAAR
jgi:hypothetical protein